MAEILAQLRNVYVAFVINQIFVSHILYPPSLYVKAEADIKPVSAS